MVWKVLAMRLRCLTLFAAIAAMGLPRAGHTQAAGSLVTAEPIVATPAGMQAWRIAYLTTSEDGRAVKVTGMVIAPREAQPREPRAVIAWAHGTSGVAEKCALSTNARFFDATPALGDMIRAGYVVVAPDYPGLGSPITHGYLVGRETGRSVLDAVRAARAIPGAFAGSRFAAWGESQGGHAALWTAIESRTYAPELTLVGTAAAAPPTDLVQNLRLGSDPNVRAMLTAFLAYSWSERLAAPLKTLFNPLERGVVTRLARNNCVDLDASPRIGTILGVAAVRKAMKNKDLGRIEPWASLARRNSPAARAVPGPVFLAQSMADPIVAPQVTLAFARALCRAGR